MSTKLVPKGTADSSPPCWVQPVTSRGLVVRPLLKCVCGVLCGLGGHEVDRGGHVSGTFFHTARIDPMGVGCGWRAELVLGKYAGPSWPAGKHFAMQSVAS